ERDDPERDDFTDETLDGNDLTRDAPAEAPREIPLQLRDGRSSRRHANVEPSEGGYVLKDLRSTNGTILRGTPITRGSEHILHDGDQIALGKTVIKFTLVDDTEAAYLARTERLAGTDNLTGLLAKHRFDSLLADAVHSAHQHPVALSVLMMDLDGLKAINDRHGHHLGAHTIGAVGHLLGEIVRGRGEACRFGGDEFCAFLPGLALDRAKLVAERIRRTVEETTFSHLNASTQVTISIGVAILTDDVGTGEELLARADRALYRAKASGRNRVAI
ncbi:MAG: GGDEF domain-containing protein, partial [Deltaproteobacteria bacterium]|nr:GGDEF domain-containing protein [Deltaproteobacteria bacterium]